MSSISVHLQTLAFVHDCSLYDRVGLEGNSMHFPLMLNAKIEMNIINSDVLLHDIYM